MRLDWDELLGGGPWVLVANLPYNVATPLVADLLDRVPAISRMLVMVQREVAERLAAGPGRRGLRGGVGEGGVLGHGLGGGAGAGDACSCRSPNVESALVRIERRDGARGGPRRRPRSGCSRWWGPGSASAGRCCGGRWRGGGCRRLHRRRRQPRGAAEELDVVAWGRLAAAVARDEGAGSGCG